MRDIPIQYNKDGFTHTLHSKCGKVAIYEQRKTFNDSTPDFVRYEVVILRQYTRDIELSNTKAGDWYLPTTNEWGRYGWTYVTLEQAQEKAKEMTKKFLEMNEKT